MKKQILLLTFLVAALLAGTSNAFGQQKVTLDQAVTDTMAIDPLSCVATSEPLHPFAGVPYTYSMQDTGIQAVGAWTWWATKDTTFIDALTGLNLADSLRITSSELLGHSANYGISGPADTVSITWSGEILAGTGYQYSNGLTPTFVVGYGEGVNCSDNIQVYELNPRQNFTIDIANIDPVTMTTLPWDEPTESCVSEVLSATYNAATFELNMDYGYDTLYFEISASNFVKNFMTYFTLLGGLEENQEAVAELYATLADAQNTPANMLETWTWDYTDIGQPTDSVMVADTFYAADPADVVDGVSLFLKVIIANNQYESLADNAFEIAVDARDDDNTGQWDMEDGDCDSSTATDAADQVDRATHTITPRPRIDHNTQDQGQPNPTTIIPKGGSLGHNPTYPQW